MVKNEIINLKISAYSSSGDGIGRTDDGFAVFVPKVALGDEITAKILKVKKNYAFAKCESIINAGPDREENDCEFFSKCGGCKLRHISYEAELKLKEETVRSNLKKIAKIDMPPEKITALNPLRYRNKAVYPIDSSGKTGLYAPNSHRVIPISDCKIENEQNFKICKAFENWISDFKVPVFDETSGKGIIRRLCIRHANATNEIMVGIVAANENFAGIDKLPLYLKNSGLNIKTVVLNINKKLDNVIFSDKTVILSGDGYITDILCGVKLRISLKTFYQVNSPMAELLYKKAAVLGEIENKTVLDLYCGAGSIGLSMAKKAKKIIGVEIVPEAVIDAKFNALANGFSNAEFICADAAKAAKMLYDKNLKPDVVIVDPPRKGCDRALIETICKDFSPERTVYVSCDSATLARDAEIFAEYSYSLKSYAPFDLFPRTSHVECVALFVKEK